MGGFTIAPRREISLSAATLVVLTGVLLLGLFQVSGAAASGCRPYELIGARGSGQKASGEGGMGPEVHDLYANLRGYLGTGALSGHGVAYPAVGVADGSDLVNGAGALLHIGFLGRYTDSVREGREDTEHEIKFRHSICPGTRYILAGYSQGAQAVGDALQGMGEGMRKLVVAAVLFGDPEFNAGSWSSRSDFDPSAYGILGVRGEWPESLHGDVFSYCHYHDIICNDAEALFGGIYVRNFDDLDNRKAAHVTPAYRSVSQQGRGDADEAAREVARLLGVSAPPAVYTGPLDIAFVIDSTGSMADEIEEVKSDVASLVSQIASVNSDFRVALVDYKDEPEEESEYQARIDTTFTTDFAAFDASLEALFAEGGGDTPESVYSGLMTALGMEWRAGSRKLVIQLGDAAAKDPEPVTGYTLHDVQEKALSVDPATIDPIQSGDDEETTSSFTAIAGAGGGTYLQIPEEDPAALIPSIVEDVRRNAVAPTAAIAVPSAAIAGRSVVFSGGASPNTSDPIAAYEWDFEGDGKFDATTADPTVTHTYPGPFSGSAVLRVRSASGLTGSASAPIVVRAAPSGAPGRPRGFHGSIRHRTLTLSWHAGGGPPPVWFSIYGRGRKPLERVAAASLLGHGKRSVYTVTIRGLRPGGSYRYWVGAGNEAGESRRAGPVSKRVPRRMRRHRARHGR